jgi:hypothetical protein
MTINSLLGARLMGALIVAIGVGGEFIVASEVRTHGTFHLKGVLIFPFAIGLGISMIFYPMTKALAREKYGKEQMSWAQLPFGQKCLIAAGVAAGFLHWAWLAGVFF